MKVKDETRAATCNEDSSGAGVVRPVGSDTLHLLAASARPRGAFGLPQTRETHLDPGEWHPESPGPERETRTRKLVGEPVEGALEIPCACQGSYRDCSPAVDPRGGRSGMLMFSSRTSPPLPLTSRL
ncbi:hypothetical protein NDU88_007037 [Pleurodeles waltl]|uniref:Uncharacterized protein n=1 Tax=Pleurodeles waltl TaxID=8319 RepID=A0AAV7U1U6_PLEWA|nr:hypothetical protein NDU88_007037 [Pleurodeles waltl]